MTQKVKSELLADPTIVSALKTMLADKASSYRELEMQRSKYMSSSDFSELPDELAVVFKEFYFNHVMPEGKQIDLLERDITNIAYSIRSVGLYGTNRWEDAYQHATQHALIKNVVSALLGETNLRRNIACPFHEDRSPSLKVYEKGNRFVCFGCGARGSPIDFVMQFNNCSFKDAVYFLRDL